MNDIFCLSNHYWKIKVYLVNAHFFLADSELTKRLWQDVGEKNIEIDRIINLMYNCHFHEDDEAMNEADLSYLNSKGWI